MNTREAILELTQELIQTKGYNSFSYGDISEKLGIKRASIHYYFPQKVDLGVAVTIRYTDNFKEMLNSIEKDKTIPYPKKIEQYFGAFVEISSTKIKICLGGALGGEYIVLPELVQVEVQKFFDINLRFLEKVLKDGLKSGELNLSNTPKEVAYLIFSSLEGGLIIARSKNKPQHYTKLVKSIILSLTNTQLSPDK